MVASIDSMTFDARIASPFLSVNDEHVNDSVRSRDLPKICFIPLGPSLAVLRSVNRRGRWIDVVAPALDERRSSEGRNTG